MLHKGQTVPQKKSEALLCSWTLCSAHVKCLFSGIHCGGPETDVTHTSVQPSTFVRPWWELWVTYMAQMNDNTQGKWGLQQMCLHQWKEGWLCCERHLVAVVFLWKDTCQIYVVWWVWKIYLSSMDVVVQACCFVPQTIWVQSKPKVVFVIGKYQ